MPGAVSSRPAGAHLQPVVLHVAVACRLHHEVVATRLRRGEHGVATARQAPLGRLVGEVLGARSEDLQRGAVGGPQAQPHRVARLHGRPVGVGGVEDPVHVVADTLGRQVTAGRVRGCRGHQDPQSERVGHGTGLVGDPDGVVGAGVEAVAVDGGVALRVAGIAVDQGQLRPHLLVEVDGGVHLAGRVQLDDDGTARRGGEVVPDRRRRCRRSCWRPGWPRASPRPTSRSATAGGSITVASARLSLDGGAAQAAGAVTRAAPRTTSTDSADPRPRTWRADIGASIVRLRLHLTLHRGLVRSRADRIPSRGLRT